MIFFVTRNKLKIILQMRGHRKDITFPVTIHSSYVLRLSKERPTDKSRLLAGKFR
jgi:hypothetical protein